MLTFSTNLDQSFGRKPSISLERVIAVEALFPAKQLKKRIILEISTDSNTTCTVNNCQTCPDYYYHIFFVLKYMPVL